jgi:hypothetical protein
MLHAARGAEAGVGTTKCGKGTKWNVVVNGEGVALGGGAASAVAAEVTLLEETIEIIAIPGQRHGR